MPSLLVKVLNRFSYVQGLLERGVALEAEIASLGGQVAQLKEEAVRNATWVPPGHLLSPIPNVAELREREAELFGKPPAELPGIEIFVEEQVGLLKDLKKYIAESPFAADPREGRRFDPENPLFSSTDALLLYLMMRRLRPRRLVEVGSGQSTAALLDVNEFSFGRSIALTVIDPEPSFARSVLRKGDAEKVKFVTQPLHAVPLDTFSTLTAGDVVLVTSSHVLKTGSDVGHLLFRVFPKLKSGVHVAVNGVFWPFEYQQGWVFEGRACNEAYALRAFLEYTSAFEIVIFGSYLEQLHKASLAKEVPAWGRCKAGGLWMKRR